MRAEFGVLPDGTVTLSIETSTYEEKQLLTVLLAQSWRKQKGLAIWKLGDTKIQLRPAAKK